MSETAKYDITIDAAGSCKHCVGTGKIMLLTSSRRCEWCGGSGKIGELSVYHYPADTKPKDLAGRVVMVIQAAECVSETRSYGDGQEG